ncbi:MAG: DUF2973 domain-containing protein [Leptolyngbyaceae cyanobacterium]
MILHLLYVMAFTILAFLAMGNLIRSMITLGSDSQRHYVNRNANSILQSRQVVHPELLDNSGNIINEPLLVMKSITVEDAREKLDALYEASPSSPASEPREDV